MTLRYGLRRVLPPDHPEHYPDEILDVVRRLLTTATERTSDLNWSSFAVAIYSDGPRDRFLVVDAEIAEEEDDR